MKQITKVLAIAAFALTASSASAAVVTFNGSPSTTFADGTFSKDLSGFYADGFYATSATSAYNGYGQTGLYISFNTAMRLEHLTLRDDFGLAGVKVDLFDSTNKLLGTQSINFSNEWQSTLTFDTNNVSKIVFNNIGGDDYYDNGLKSGWYNVSNINYSANAADVPEPSVLALLAFGLLGVGISRRRTQ